MSTSEKHKLANLLNRISLAAQIVERNPVKLEDYIGMIRGAAKEAIILIKGEEA